MSAAVGSAVAEAFRGRRVLVTGHSGFKGGWLSLWLNELGAQVTGIALPPPGGPSFHESVGVGAFVDERFADIRDAAALRAVAAGVDAEIVFHLAAQPIVLRSHREPAETFATNVAGTANVLDLARAMPSLRAVVVVTSDKCYDDGGGCWPYREDDRLGGTDPYSASKACAELVAESYRRMWFRDPTGPQLGTARAGNVIGGGDWGKDRLIPDIVRAAAEEHSLLIRNPRSLRPWQHVLEPLSGYLLLAARMMEPGGARYAGGWNFGPTESDTLDVEALARGLMRCSPNFALPVRFAPVGPAVGEAVALRLDSSRARHLLGWRSRLPIAKALAMTAAWYDAFLAGAGSLRDISRAQLADYQQAAVAQEERAMQCA